MATLLDSVENSIWHAFDFLALEGDGTATKVKLKVGLFLFDIFFTYFLNTVKCEQFYYSILNYFGQRSQHISIKFPLHKQSEKP